MKKEIIKLLALLLFGAAALTGCAIDNGRYHDRNRNDRHNSRGHDRDHNGHYDNHGGYNHY